MSSNLKKKNQELNINGYLEINNIFTDIELRETIDYL